MWTRKELKERAKISFKANYWRSVLVALIFMLIAGGANAVPTFTQHFGGNSHNSTITESQNLTDDMDLNTIDDGISMTTKIVFVIIFASVALVIAAIILLLNFFLFNPLEIGCNRFFLTNLTDKAEIKEVCFTFDRGYKNGVKVLFFRDLFVLLWSLLLIIPGIIKSYEYRMIPFLMAENPDMDRQEAFERSKDMMNGNKWSAFVLDLSFILWYFLSAITLGIVAIFYVNPYMNQTNAALYERLKGTPAAPVYEAETQETV